MLCRFPRLCQFLGGMAFLMTTTLTPLIADEQTDLLKRFREEFVEITPGMGKFPAEFQMGSESDPNEGPVHRVKLTHNFAINKYEVPQNLYEAVQGKNPSRWTGPRNSVEMMTYAQAVDFCHKVTEMLRDKKLIAADEEIRLPTEAEWEYCCRAGTKTAYSFGDVATADGDQENQASVLSNYAWHTGNAAGNDPPVGALKPNAWGLYDMHGYLWEFTADDWHENYEQAPADGSAWKKPDTADDLPPRVLRSGSWKDKFPKLRSAARRKLGPNEAGDEIGFRCILAKVKA